MNAAKEEQMDKKDNRQVFIMRETREYVVITKDRKKLLVNYIDENLKAS